MSIDKKAALEQIDAALKTYGGFQQPQFGVPTPPNERQKLSEIFSCLKATLERLAPPGSFYHRKATNGRDVADLAGALKALRKDYEAGYLASLTEQIHGETFSDFLDMASHLLTEGYKDAAATIAGGVLEQHLRALCVKHSVTPIPENLNNLNMALYKKAYQSNDMKLINAWGDTRNAAAHGDYAKVVRGQVEMMIQGIRQFMSANPA